MRFGALSNLPNYYLKHKVLKKLIKRYDIYDNTIHAIAGEVEITTHKIGNAISVQQVIPKELNEEDYAAHKLFQGKTQAALSKLVIDTPLNTDENKRLFMRAFVLFIQKCFLLPTSAANVTTRALPTIFDVVNTRRRNWALHVHNFLLEEVKKAKLHNTKSINGCCYAMLIIYFHETHFGKNAKEPEAQPPWIRYWNSNTLWKRLKEEKCHAAVNKSGAGLVKTGQIKDEKDRFQKKNPKKNASSESESEYEESSSFDESYSGSDSEETISEELIQRKQNTKPNPIRDKKRSKKKHGMNATEEMYDINEPLHLSQLLTQGSVVDSVPEPPHQPPPQEEQPPHQTPHREEQQSQQPHPEEEIIDISSSPEDEHEPTPSRVFFPLIPKAEEEPIYPTQEVIDISSSSDDEPEPTPIQVLISKAEVDYVSSPCAKSITEVLLSMSKEHPTHSEPDDAPSFDLGIDYGTGPHQTQEERLLTTQVISDIEELDELIREKGDQFQTPQPTQSLNIRHELHDRVANWATMPTWDNEY
ncbi:hypothetical protein PIB30_055401 [Stylosanthes scabra]|uniref:Uncharacterized protein n=1 Tax=Stylosanthes scabra TaxID=79078 RepID=A0ABU6WJ15_9FABA|nr:hypothetical protein [Stylosanthes scabra]